MSEYVIEGRDNYGGAFRIFTDDSALASAAARMGQTVDDDGCMVSGVRVLAGGGTLDLGPLRLSSAVISSMASNPQLMSPCPSLSAPPTAQDFIAARKARAHIPGFIRKGQRNNFTRGGRR